MKLLVTGGAGFIGSNFVRYMLGRYDDLELINLDNLTYAGNLDNLKDIEKNPRYRFVKGDIANADVVAALVPEVDAIVNFAAETHVDRSIHDPGGFIQTDVVGIYVLLEEARKSGTQKIVLVSTDEVYGSIIDGSFCETDRLNPSSPYSASKAGGELLALAYQKTFGLPVCITRGSNTYGPYQYPEKVIPLFVTNALDDIPLPLYGDGMNVRDWLYVTDHCSAILTVLETGSAGETYNVGGWNEMPNIEIVKTVCALLDEMRPDPAGPYARLLTYVKDRPGHDRRYAIDAGKIHRELGWKPAETFETGIRKTVRWYLDNMAWVEHVASGEYRKWLDTNYAERGAQ
jgi:dTDP-glucose 4,6-dehydratase